MTPTLPRVAHEHHERILHAVDQFPELGDRLLAGPTEDVLPQLDSTHEFLTGLLIPHMEAAERALYPELERMMQNVHSMAPMRREHQEVRQLVLDFDRLRGEVRNGHLTVGRALALRRVIYRLFAVLKVHLAEEEMYVRIVEHGVTADVADMLAAAMAHPGIPNA